MAESPKLSEYYGLTRPEILDSIPGDCKNLLDIGCGAGGLGAGLRHAGKRMTLVGIERETVPARIARELYDEVHELDLETHSPVAASLSASVDTVVLADVLEHLVDPWSVLRSLVSSAKPGTRWVVSVPNVRSAEVLVRIAAGQFSYRDSGILDRTHLRFFDRRSAHALLHQAGISVSRVSKSFPPQLPRVGSWPFRLLGPFGVRQYVFFGVNE